MWTGTIVDSHIHLWDLNKLYYDWLTDKIVSDDIVGDYRRICRNYLPEDFLRDLPPGEHVIAVHVDCALGHRDPVDETKFVASLAKVHPWIGAIIGRGDLTDRRFDVLLDRHLAASNLFRGIRMFGPPETWSTSKFKSGLRSLLNRNLIFALDADPETMDRAGEMAKVCDVKIVLDHAGFPKQRTDEYFQRWRVAMKTLAAHENVICKVSGLGMADHRWTEDTIRRWVEGCLEAFGIERCIFGTNWPVDSLYSDYARVVTSYRHILSSFSEDEQRRFFLQNALDCYSIREVPSKSQGISP